MKTLKQIALLIIVTFFTTNSHAQFNISCLSSIQNLSTGLYTTKVYWEADTNLCGGTVSYNVYELTSKTDVGNLVYTGTNTNFTLPPSAIQPKFIRVEALKTSCTNTFSYYEPKDVVIGVGPEQLILDSVSVSQTNKAFMGWQTKTISPIKEYIILRYDALNDALSEIDRQPSPLNHYSNLNSIAGSQVEGYLVRVVDQCNNESPLPAGNPPPGFKTIYLTATYNKCNREAAIRWTTYEDFEFGVKEYQLHFLENGKDSIITTTKSLAYNHTNLNFNAKYAYYIRAFENGTSKTSSSNLDTIQTQTTRPLDTLSLISASVINNAIRLAVVLDDSSFYNYKIYRSENNSDLTELSDLTVLDTSYVEFTDVNVDLVNNVYNYQVVAFDSCGIPLDSTKIHSTIKLDVTSGSFLNNLNWTNYVGLNTISDTIKVFRLKDGTWETSPFYSFINANDSSKIDSLRLFYESSNEFCYFIEIYNSGQTIKSNIACDKQKTLIYVPSGLVANTVNEFKPVGTFINEENYKLEVYNKWGAKVFESINKNIGWTGENAPMGSYIYLIEYQIQTGEIIIKRGLVTLLR